MKKQLAFIMSAVLLLSMCACKSKDKQQSSSSSSEQSSSAVQSSSQESSQLSSEQSSSTIQTNGQLTSSDVDIEGLGGYENTKKGWGQGYNVDDKNRPTSAVSYQEKYGQYGGVFIMPDTEKTIYLTFDEGYENGYTSKILDTLKEKNVHAVFFVTMPYVKQNPELIKRMIAEGHIVGNHSVHHKSMPTLDTKTAINEIVELHNYVLDNFNYEMTLFRPPMGEWSTRTMVLAKELHYKTVLWSFAYKDYDTKNQIGVEKAFPRVTGAAHSGAVYLLHAVSKDNTEMLSDVIDKLQKDGYTFKGLS